MGEKFIEPKFNANAFTCPHCQVVAQIEFCDYNDLNEKILKNLSQIEDITNQSQKKFHLYKADFELVVNRINNIQKDLNLYKAYSPTFAICQHCCKINIWIDKIMVYPKPRLTPPPNEDLPDDIKKDYEEASLILQDSPRAACAILRLALEKLVQYLGGKEEKLSESVQNLIDKKIIEKDLKNALDAVRIIGNNAVHPSNLDLSDNKEIAMILFDIINHIAQKVLSNKKQIDKINSFIKTAKHSK